MRGMNTQPISAGPIRMLRKPEIKQLTGMSDTTLWREVKAGRFPTPVRISSQSVAWTEPDYNAWAASRLRTDQDPRPSPNPRARRRARSKTKDR
jgi:prophage regulatory protein